MGINSKGKAESYAQNTTHPAFFWAAKSSVSPNLLLQVQEAA